MGTQYYSLGVPGSRWSSKGRSWCSYLLVLLRWAACADMGIFQMRCTRYINHQLDAI